MVNSVASSSRLNKHIKVLTCSAIPPCIKFSLFIIIGLFIRFIKPWLVIGANLDNLAGNIPGQNSGEHAINICLWIRVRYCIRNTPSPTTLLATYSISSIFKPHGFFNGSIWDILIDSNAHFNGTMISSPQILTDRGLHNCWGISKHKI